MKFEIGQINQRSAKKFIRKHHRHLPKPPAGWKFGGGAFDNDDNLIGVIWIGRPVARHYDDGSLLEINRLCTIPNIPNLNTQLIAWAVKECKKNYKKVRGLITYLRTYEKATVMQASNFFFVGVTGKGKWRRNNPEEPKQRWYYPFCKKSRKKLTELWRKNNKHQKIN